MTGSPGDNLNQENIMRKLKCILLVTAFALGTCMSHAQDSGALLDLLVKKKVLSDQEAEEVRADLVKEYTNTSAGKINISAPVKELKIYGDTRLRYEYRVAQNQGNSHDSAGGDRFRYRFRLGMDLKLTEDWFVGIRLETAPGGRSTNITMGPSGNPTGNGIWNKSANGINLGQIYVKNTTLPWLTVEAGRMPNPLVCSQMVWDSDLNPEGFAQQLKYSFGPFEGAGKSVSDGKGGKTVVESGEPNPLTIDVFANFGEFVYDSGWKENSFGATQSYNDIFLFALQGGAKVNFNKSTFLQVAPTLYLYNSNKNVDYTAGSTSANIYSGAIGGNQYGINNLEIFDIPVEFDWSMAGQAFRAFGEFAYNIQGAERATRAQKLVAPNVPAANVGGQNIAWQAGLGVNKIKKKGDWETTIYWQSSGQYALDPNMIDDDVFDGHLNMQGVVVRAAYALTDAVSLGAAYNYGGILNKQLGTGGYGGLSNNEKTYNLVQLDVNVKF